MPRRLTRSASFCQSVVRLWAPSGAITRFRPEVADDLERPSRVSVHGLSSTLVRKALRADLVRRLHQARFVIIVDVAIILGGIILVAWLVDGQAS